MNETSKHSGFAIALAWPQTFCKQTGAWYDAITPIIGFNQNNYYQVGHAAVVLVNSKKKQAHYFDFGRYHAPFQHGRVRSATTDHELLLHTLPQTKNDQILNYEELIHEIQSNNSCHGEGPLWASYCTVDFFASHQRALHLQNHHYIPYGPFVSEGTNCSRFVSSVILAGNPERKHSWKMKFLTPLTPTPKTNVQALKNKIILEETDKKSKFYPSQKIHPQQLQATLVSPSKHPDIPQSAQWLAGEGAGSWFAVEIQDDYIAVTRFSPVGIKECEGRFENKIGTELLRKSISYEITYPSHCELVSIKLGAQTYHFTRL